MKQYIDLTQLSANQIGRMVCELTYNNISGLEKFYNSLGNLYGYPLQDTVNVYSRNLMLDKCELNKAFENYSFKRFVDLMDAISAFLSTETTPLSDFTDFSEWTEEKIGENTSNISTLSNSLSNFCACNSRVVIGRGSYSPQKHNSVAIGLSAITDEYSDNSIAIGHNAIISSDINDEGVDGAIQLGSGTNTSPGSFQVRNYTLLDNNGLIPNGRLANLSSLDGEVLSALAEQLKPIILANMNNG